MTFLYLNSDTMGQGDPILGKKLMKIFLQTLLESGEKIDTIGCVNSAIKLTTEGSEVIDTLKEFEKNGARIATCGTCLDFHGNREKLKIGGTGTMKDAVKLMFTADKIIRPN
ncbi:MAG: sulfurtransferase-like selenium metabolism protein YedF [Candidatus Delongbacteria bacterium]|nr:sulfurtransferase-like selenium metabolism protein YedF [Candidatus Delongbacteria bacterium]